MNKNFNLERYLNTELKKFKAPNRPDVFFGETYIGGGTSKLTFWNLAIPDVRGILKRPLPFHDLSLSEQFRQFDKVWISSHIFEVKMTAIHWLESLSTEQLIVFSKKIAKWAQKIDTWAESDGLCGIYARIFEASPKSLDSVFKNWNTHKNPWLRRCSMVSVFYYSRMRRKHASFKYAITMVKPHLAAPEYYVQKGLGWTLREIYNVYPAETTKFIRDNLSRIHAHAWYAASEKMPLKLKAELVLERRKLRKLSIFK